MKHSFGKNIKVTVFGASHAPEVGVTVSGLPAGEEIDRAALDALISRRKADRYPFSSGRHEADEIEFVTGVAEGRTTGEDLTAIVRNLDARPGTYEKTRTIPRPGHADYTSFLRYGEIFPGGGPFSGRMTLPLTIAGGIALQILERRGIRIFAGVESIAEIADEGELAAPVREHVFPTVSEEAGKRMTERLVQAKAEGDSFGGVIRCRAEGIPAALGGPLFEGVEGRLAEALFAIPAVKGVDFGLGFRGTQLTGDEYQDAFIVKDGRVETETNHAGGILGGLTDGMPVEFRVAVKPTPTDGKQKKTVDLETMTPVETRFTGRHDACIVPRAVPVVEAVAALVFLDLLLDNGTEEKSAGSRGIAEIRREIDRCDQEIAAAFEKRQKLAREIGEVKAKAGLPVFDPEREKEKIARFRASLPEELKADGETLIQILMDLAKKKETE